MQAWGGAISALARLRARSALEGTQVHPADLDDALCTSGALASSGGDGETRLPFAVDDALLQGAPGQLWAVRALHGPQLCYPAPVACLLADGTCVCLGVFREWHGKGPRRSQCDLALLWGSSHHKRSSTASSRGRCDLRRRRCAIST